jgi:hypothetical protein
MQHWKTWAGYFCVLASVENRRRSSVVGVGGCAVKRENERKIRENEKVRERGIQTVFDSLQGIVQQSSLVEW